MTSLRAIVGLALVIGLGTASLTPQPLSALEIFHRDTGIDSIPHNVVTSFRSRLIDQIPRLLANAHSAAEIVGVWRREKTESALELNPALHPVQSRAATRSLGERHLVGRATWSNEIQGSGVTEEWARLYSSMALPSQDYANALAVDSLANVYITGSSTAMFSGGDYFTMKLNPLGDTVWTRRYNGDGNGFDEATAMAIAPDGSVTVTGYSAGFTTSDDYITIKYSPGGVVLWIQRYDGPNHLSDVATGVAVDTAGNVFVTGYSYATADNIDLVTIMYAADGTERWVARRDDQDADEIPTAIQPTSAGVYVTGFSMNGGIDYLTLKYNIAGMEEWSNRYNGTGDSTDVATGLDIDSQGNVCVTGYGRSSVGGFDFVTVKYSSNGQWKWEASYNGPGNGSDRAVAIDVDQSDHVVVSGTSRGIERTEDFATVVYDSSGHELWSNRYGNTSSDDQVVAQALDGENNIYIVGEGSTSPYTSGDFVTISYTPDGVLRWTNRYDASGTSIDQPTAISLDPFGHVYCTGTSTDANGQSDYVTIRYDQLVSPFVRKPLTMTIVAMAIDDDDNIYVTGSDSGHIVTSKMNSAGATHWVAYVRGTGSEPAAITVDPLGNVYVTGSERRAGGTKDCATMKYSPTGEQEWIAYYDGGSGDDQAVGVVVDKDGSVYVTGTSAGSQTMADYITIKYTPTGSEQWVARYDGPSSKQDSAVAIALDADKNILITGSSYRGDSFDIVTLKYSPQGVRLWDAVYGGSLGQVDIARDVGVDAKGCVYVVGHSFNAQTSFDFTILKYSASGDQLWIRQHDGSSRSTDLVADMVIDRRGNIIVTGPCVGRATDSDYLTVEYDSNGTLQWIARYEGPDAGDDVPVSLATDIIGNVYVTGTSSGIQSERSVTTIKYTAVGIEEWHVRSDWKTDGSTDARVVAADQHGYVYVGGAVVDQNRSVLLQYASIGMAPLKWPLRYDGPGVGFDQAEAIASDDRAGVIVTGASIQPYRSADILTLKYDATGSIHWSTTYNDPSNSFDTPTALVIDRDASTIITGAVGGIYSPIDIGTIKYDSVGNLLWVARYNSPNNSYDFVTGIALDSQSNIYVTGYSFSGTSYDYLTVKYNAAGVQQWVARFNGQSDGDDLATAIGIDRTGDVIVTGFSYGPGTASDYVTIRYDQHGEQRWIARYNGSLNGEDRPIALALDEQQSVYVTGWSAGMDTTYDFLTLKYDSAGQFVWEARTIGGSGSTDRPAAIARDDADNIVVTGRSYAVNSIQSDFLTVKYGIDGHELWRAVYDGPVGGDDIPHSVVLDQDGSVYVTGKSIGADQTYDVATVKYNPGGWTEWIARYSCGHNCTDEPAGLFVDLSGNVFVAGTSGGQGWSVISTLKYKQDLLTDIATLEHSHHRFELLQNYPNPFNPVTDVRYALPALRVVDRQAGISDVRHVSLKVFDVLGREVATLVNEVKQPGEYTLRWDASRMPSGVYFYRIIAGNFTDTKKMLLVR